MRVIVIVYRYGKAIAITCDTVDEIGGVLRDEDSEYFSIYAAHLQGEDEVRTGSEARDWLRELLPE